MRSDASSRPSPGAIAHSCFRQSAVCVRHRQLTTTEGDERVVDVVADLPTDARAAKPVPQRDRSFHDPAVHARAGRVVNVPGCVLRGCGAAKRIPRERANRVSYLRRRGIGCTIPEPVDQIRSRRRCGSAGARPPAFDRQDDTARHAVDCGISRLEPHRGRCPSIRQTCRPLRGDDPDRGDPAVAVTRRRPTLPCHADARTDSAPWGRFSGCQALPRRQ